jgi:hypothetical protein
MRALVVPDSGDLGHLFEPVEGQVSNPWSVGPCGVAARCSRISHLQVSRVLGRASSRAADQ